MNFQRVQSYSAPQLRSGLGTPGGPPPANGPVTPGNHERPFIRLNLLRALQLHRNLAMGIALGGLVLALAYVVKAWPVYTAQSQLYVQPIQSKVMAGPDQSFTSNSAAYDSFVQQQVQSASNPDVLISALHKLKPGSWQRSGESEQAAAARLGGTIEVARQGTSYEVAIAAKAKDPQLVAQIANAVGNSIVERASGEGNAGNVQRMTVLREERDRIQNELTSDYAEQNDLNKQLGMAAVGTEAPDLIDADIGKTREELIKAQTEHDEAEARFSAMGAGKGDSSSAIDAEADDMVAADAGLTSMKSSLNSRRALLITQMSNLTPNNPEYKQDAAELAKINSGLDTMMKDLRAKAAARIQQKLRMDLERTAGVESRLNGQLRQLAGTAASATPKLQRASDLATNISRLRNRFTNVDDQLHNLMLESSAPGAVHLSVAAVPPLHPAISGILKKALPLVLGGLLFGLLAASIANHLDPRVYIGADIEQVLGFAPMAVLPDFDEVSAEVSAEHLLRLSSAIEHARKQGSLNNCIFTGTSSGVGVTTLVRRVQDILAAMGRATVLLDSSGTPPGDRASSRDAASDEHATQRGSRSTALLRQVVAETEMEMESLVLTDTAPLLISAETEYLARFVDCAIVVAESGVTTRSQLLAAVNTLQRLDVAAMGFVLNRVKLAKADPAFRHSVQEIEKHQRAQSAATPKRAKRTSQVADELLPETKELPRESSATASSAPTSSDSTSGPAVRRSSAVASQWSKAAPVEVWLPQPARTSEKPVVEPADEDNPWWLSDGHAKPPAAPAQVANPHESAPPAPPAAKLRTQPMPLESWETASSRKVDFKPQRVEEAAPVAVEEIIPVAREATSPVADKEARPDILEEVTPIANSEATPIVAAESVVDEGPHIDREEKPYESPSRLNGLRGLLFSIGLKKLSKARELEQLEIESPFVPARETKAEPEPEPEPKIERTVIARAFAPFAEPAPVPPPPVEFKSASNAPREVTTLPEFLPPKEFVPVRERESTREATSPSRSDRRDAYDELNTLPSRRGQYKRRG
jgi:uncharacterized protein involved in exopolysaccharide biosynthesis